MISWDGCVISTQDVWYPRVYDIPALLYNIPGCTIFQLLLYDIPGCAISPLLLYDIPGCAISPLLLYDVPTHVVRYPRSYCTISQGVWCMISLLMLYDILGCTISPLLLYDIYVRTIPFRHSPASRGRHITLLADKTPAYLSPALTLIYLSQSWQTFMYLSQTLSKTFTTKTDLCRKLVIDRNFWLLKSS